MVMNKAQRFFLIADNPALDFANTIVQPGGDAAGAIRTWADVTAFLKTAGKAEGPGTARNAHDGAAAFQLARKLRDDLRDILAALVSGRKIPPEALESINRVLALGAGYPMLVPGRKGWELTYVRRSESAAAALIPIAEAAATIVTSGGKAGIRECANPACVLFFQDRTGRRRWCSMAVCGNRAKVAAFARRRMTFNANAAARGHG